MASITTFNGVEYTIYIDRTTRRPGMTSITTAFNGVEYTIYIDRNTDDVAIYADGCWAGDGTAREHTPGMWTIDDCAAVLGDDVYAALDSALTEYGEQVADIVLAQP